MNRLRHHLRALLQVVISACFAVRFDLLLRPHLEFLGWLIVSGSTRLLGLTNQSRGPPCEHCIQIIVRRVGPLSQALCTIKALQFINWRSMNKLISFYKYILSFTKRTWHLKDYPVYFTNQLTTSETPDVLPWVARISNWHLTGLGQSKESAFADLQTKFENYRNGNALSRPGTKVPLQFSDTGKIDAFGDFAYEFVEETYGVMPFFMSDLTSMSDFGTPEELEEMHAAILKLYSFNSREYESRPLWELLDAIQRNGA